LRPDVREQLQASLGNTCVIERELGGGGMSRVFLATDRTLDRSVVVKVLSEEYSAGVNADRFRREIQLIARLQHPHVVPILSAGTADGALYYVMPFLGGESLRARMAREGPLPVADCARILREMLDALAFAHSHGVIHRDIKPENVLIQAGHAVVADFGVAKALRESGTLTSAGVALGTPTYMAPEQAVADPSADHRADLYAVGVVAYEMLCGAAPFTGSPQQVITAHMTMVPVPVRQRRPDVPEPLATMVMRALEKDASARPQSAAEMLGVIDAVLTPGEGATRGSVAATRRRLRPVRWAGAGVLLVGAAALAAWRLSRAPVMASAQSIAIVPFSVATGDTSLVRLGQNLVTTVSANLDGIGDIRVADAMTVLSHARTRRTLLSATDAIAIARALGAKSVLHGTLVPTGATVRADAALYDVSAPSAPVARVNASAPADSLTALTDSLTWRLLRAVWNRGRPPTPNVASITTHSAVALREFLEGERLFARGGFLEAAAAYERAIAADTTFWFAYNRYVVTRGWMAQPADTTLTRRLQRHRAELPERDRLLVSAGDSSPTQTRYIQRLREITARFPEYAPAWVTLADYLIHHAMRSGHDVRESIAPWEKVVQLMPADQTAAEHLAQACTAAGDLACARRAFAHADSLFRADSAPPLIPRMLHRSLGLTLADSKSATDSVVTLIRRDSVGPLPGSTHRIAHAPALLERADFWKEWDRVADLPAAFAQGPLGPDLTRYLALSLRAMRGDWSVQDSAVILRRSITDLRGFPISRLEALRARVLAELQGMAPPERRTADDALAAAGASASVTTEARWIAATNALVRGDSALYREQVGTLTRDTTVAARIAARSVRAIAAGRAGATAAAAESLLVLEREHGENAPKVWGAFAADRLLGAQWLADARRFAPADSLLRFTRGFIITGTNEAAWPIFASAQLLRSRVAEGMGRKDDAIMFATLFLRVFDLAPPSQKALTDEARQRIARLGGPADTVATTPVRPRG
jgi:TolB-like protein